MSALFLTGTSLRTPRVSVWAVGLVLMKAEHGGGRKATPVLLDTSFRSDWIRSDGQEGNQDEDLWTFSET